MIYLATPYSHPSSDVRQWRYEQARCLWWHYTAQGYEFWRTWDEHMIALSEAMWIAHIPGWERSRGMAAEIAYAKRVGVLCVHLPKVKEILERHGLTRFRGG